MSAPPLTWLYVPADRPDRVEKALASRAHAVIVDLEDAVAPAAKDAARAGLAALLGEPLDRIVPVRVNAPGTRWVDDDLRVAAGLPGVTAINLPKVDDPLRLEELAARLGGKPLHCLVESARGLEEAYAIARVPVVAGISLGEADLGGETGSSGDGLDWARSRVVNAAVAAGLPRPPQSVYPHVRDLDGLRESCRRGRTFGFLGRAAIHPGQLETIESVYLPSAAEHAAAAALLDGFDESAGAGVGAYVLADGSFVDVALVRSARQTLAVAEAHGTRDG